MGKGLNIFSGPFQLFDFFLNLLNWYCFPLSSHIFTLYFPCHLLSFPSNSPQSSLLASKVPTPICCISPTEPFSQKSGSLRSVCSQSITLSSETTQSWRPLSPPDTFLTPLAPHSYLHSTSDLSIWVLLDVLAPALSRGFLETGSPLFKLPHHVCSAGNKAGA